MAFKTLFIAHVPDSDPDKNNCILETPKYNLFVRLVREQKQALEICKKLVNEEGIESIILCPGFTHKDIAEIVEVVGSNVGITVARGDGPSSKIAAEAMKRAGWF